MYRLLKRLLSIAVVLAAIALILNLKIAGKPARDHAAAIWGSEAVQKIYRVVRDRVLALIRKDISVEDVFKPDLPANPAEPPATQKAPAKPMSQEAAKEETRTIQLEKLDEEDRRALEKILEKSSQ